MKIVVIGGTGLIGSKVVEKLKQKGHEAIAVAPNTDVSGMSAVWSLWGKADIEQAARHPNL